MLRPFLFAVLVVTAAALPLHGVCGDHQAMLEKLQDAYGAYKSRQAGPGSGEDYVEAMNTLSISAMVFKGEQQKTIFYLALKRKRDELYASLLNDWKESDIEALHRELRDTEQVDFLYRGAREFLEETH